MITPEFLIKLIKIVVRKAVHFIEEVFYKNIILNDYVQLIQFLNC